MYLLASKIGEISSLRRTPLLSAYQKVAPINQYQFNVFSVEYEVVKRIEDTNQIVHFIKDFVIRIQNIENRLQPLIENAISTHTLNELQKLIDQAWIQLFKFFL